MQKWSLRKNWNFKKDVKGKNELIKIKTGKIRLIGIVFLMQKIGEKPKELQNRSPQKKSK